MSEPEAENGTAVKLLLLLLLLHLAIFGLVVCSGKVNL